MASKISGQTELSGAFLLLSTLWFLCKRAMKGRRSQTKYKRKLSSGVIVPLFGLTNVFLRQCGCKCSYCLRMFYQTAVQLNGQHDFFFCICVCPIPSYNLGQIIHILRIISPTVSVPTHYLCHDYHKSSLRQHVCGYGYVPIKHYLQNQTIGWFHS